MRHLATLGFAAFAVVLCLGAAAGAAEAATHVIKVTEEGFTPAALVIARDDVVRWEWESGNHLLRNGENPEDPEAGELWELPLNSGTRVQEIRFDVTGTYQYFSAPYFNSGVKGMVEVKESTDAEPQTWGRLKTLFNNTRPVNPF